VAVSAGPGPDEDGTDADADVGDFFFARGFDGFDVEGVVEDGDERRGGAFAGGVVVVGVFAARAMGVW
jgi:hypothetical protein